MYLVLSPTDLIPICHIRNIWKYIPKSEGMHLPKMFSTATIMDLADNKPMLLVFGIRFTILFPFEHWIHLYEEYNDKFGLFDYDFNINAYVEHWINHPKSVKT